jgi:uncharacterized phage protein gp47/JayE
MSNTVFLKDFDTLLEQILTDYSNIDPAPDVSEGSIVWIKSACLASMAWGIYRYQDWLANQIFPDTATSDNLNHHGFIYGIQRLSQDTDATYLAKILNFLRTPPAGGNANDYYTWALQTPTTGGYYVTSASVITPPTVTLGTVTVVIIPNDMSIIGTGAMDALVVACYNYINPLRPVTASLLTVMAPTFYPITVNISVTGASGVTLDTTTMSNDIKSYFASLTPGQAVYISKLESICINDGALNATVSSPASDVTPTPSQLITLSSVTITQL